MNIEKSRFSFTNIKRLSIIALAAAYIGGFGVLVTGGGKNITPVPRGAVKECVVQNDGASEYKFACLTLGAISQAYNELLKDTGNKYQTPQVVLYKDKAQSPCGLAETNNPFYCPTAKAIYVDLKFSPAFSLAFGSCPLIKGGCEAFAFYVLAHEYAHHVQEVLGAFKELNRLYAMGASQELKNAESVRVELQADCFAGASIAVSQKNNAGMIDGVDIAAMTLGAESIGDDRILRTSERHQFTHGSANERVAAFTKGYEAKSLKACF
jgi:predicted metalloprotease